MFGTRNLGLIHFACSTSPGWRFRHIWRMTKLAFGSGMIVRGVAFREDRWVVAAEGQGTRSCSGCGETSRSRHSWHVRRLQDLPIQGVPATLELRSGRWKCRNEQCARKTFAEKLAIALPFARKTRRVGELVRLFGHAAGGRASERLLAGLGMPMSDSTVLRQLQSHVRKHREPNRCARSRSMTGAGAKASPTELLSLISSATWWRTC
jgi:hypothetical protein